MANNPMDYFRQLEQMGDQIRNMFGSNEFVRNFMPNIPDMVNQAPTGTPPSAPFANGFDWMKGAFPRVDIYQTGREVIAFVEVPGIENSADVNISVEPNRLYIRGNMKRQHTHIPQENIIMTERHSGTFERDLNLPVRVLPKEVKATYKHGILEIRMMKDDRSDQGAPGHVIPIQF